MLAVMRCVLSLLGVGLVLSAIAAPTAPRAPRTLAILDNSKLKTSHSQFFNWISKDLGHDLVFRSPVSDAQLGQYGEFYYDNLILMAPSTPDFKWTLTTQQILEFLEAGNNVFLVGGSSVSEILREVALEAHVEFDPEQVSVFDHFNNVDGEPTVVYTKQWIENSGVLGKDFSKTNTAPVIFPKGKAMVLSDESDLVIPVLRAESTAYSIKESATFASDSLETAGLEIVLVAALQTLSNARATFVGSIDMLSDEYFDKTIAGVGSSGNRIFAQYLSAWTFRDRGFLQIVLPRHFKGHGLVNGSMSNPSSYRIADLVSFYCRIEEYDGVRKTWLPYVANDVQLEAIMLDPYIRLNLYHDHNGNYFLKFRLPDVFGVYKLEIRHSRLGYSNLKYTNVVSVHPYRHDEYDRFIPAAYPYYASAFSMMAGFFLLSILFLFSKDK